MSNELLTATETELLAIGDLATEQITLVEYEVLVQTVAETIETIEPELLTEQVTGPTEVLDAAATVEILEVGIQGPPGPPGVPGPAGGQTMQRAAGEGLSALRAVYELNGAALLLDCLDGAHIDLLLGVTITSANSGAPVNVQRSGVIEDAGWGWTPGRVYLGTAGALTQTNAPGGYDVLIGVATAATSLTLNLQDPIELE